MVQSERENDLACPLPQFGRADAGSALQDQSEGDVARTGRRSSGNANCIRPSASAARTAFISGPVGERKSSASKPLAPSSCPVAPRRRTEANRGAVVELKIDHSNG